MALKDLVVLGLQAENVKRVQFAALTLDPAGGVVEIAGENGEGKSSLLDAIEMAIGGGDSIPWMPIRNGEEAAEIRVQLGNAEGLQLTLRRTFTAREDGTAATALTVTTGDGMRPMGAQTLLDTLTGAISMDPVEFERMKAPDKVRVIRGLIPGVDFDVIAERRKTAFVDRTVVNREARMAEAAWKRPDEDGPSVLVDLDSLRDALANAGASLREYDRLVAERVEFESDRVLLRQEAERMRVESAELIRKAETTLQLADKLDAKMAALPELIPPPDTAALSEQIREGEQHNRKVDADYAARKEGERIAGLRAEADALTKTIETCDAEVADAIREAELPVSGLTFTEDQVFLRGVPFEQASQAERLKTSLAVGMALNPKLKVILVRDGSRLDKASMALVAEVAAEEGYQIWVERVGDGGPEAIVMDCGLVRGAPPKPEPEAPKRKAKS